MKENFEFIGRQYSEEEASEQNEQMKKWSAESVKPIDGELEKTKDDVEVIDTANLILKNELESLRIEGFEPIPLGRVHILPAEVFEKQFPGFDGVAQFQSISDAIYVNRGKQNQKRSCSLECSMKRSIALLQGNFMLAKKVKCLMHVSVIASVLRGRKESSKTR